MERIIQGDVLEALRRLPSGFVHTCVTSPPYWNLRDYGVPGQIGLEPTPEEYVEKLVEVFREVRRVLRDDGTLWLNLGDSYAMKFNGGKGRKAGTPKYNAINEQDKPPRDIPNGLKPKDLVGIPWRVAFALQADGWYLRSDIIWHKSNAMPESVKDRPTKAHEYIFLLSKSPRYYYDADAIREPYSEASQARYKYGFGGNPAGQVTKNPALPKEKTVINQNPKGRNRRTVWTVSTRPFKGAHFAVFPPDLIEPCILAGSPEKACPHCGAPWEREVEVKGESTRQKLKRLGYSQKRGAGGGKVRQSLDYAGDHNNIRERITKGWKPTCQCENNDGSGKGIVLDPFFGSGTTGLVAQQHGRQWIGIELNPEYIEIAKRRLGEVTTWNESSTAIV